MSCRWISAAVVGMLLSAPSAWAQRAVVSSSSAATTPALVANGPSLGSGVEPLASRIAQPAQAPWWVGPDPAVDETRVFTEFVTQLPIERVQRVLKNPGMFRVVEAG